MTRRYSHALASLFLLLLGGCLSRDTMAPSAVHKSLSAPSAARAARADTNKPAGEKNVVQLDFALIELPIGDPFLNSEVWKSTDEFVVNLDRKAAVEDNGLRVGHIVGMTPSRLLALLRSERTCVDPRRRLVAPETTADTKFGPVLAKSSFQFRQGDTDKEFKFEQAQYALSIKPTVLPGGRVKMQFTPIVEHGTLAFPIRVAADYSGWVSKMEKPCQRLEDVGWESTIESGDFLVVGTDLNKVGTFGYQAMVQPDGRKPCQRLLVIRAAHFGTPGIQNTTADAPRRGHHSLASRAAHSAFRGYRED